MQEFSSVSVSSYEAGALADKLTQQSREGWHVVSIVAAGSTVTAYLSREADAVGEEHAVDTETSAAAVTTAAVSDTGEEHAIASETAEEESVDAGEIEAPAAEEPELAEEAEEPAAEEPELAEVSDESDIGALAEAVAQEADSERGWAAGETAATPILGGAHEITPSIPDTTSEAAPSIPDVTPEPASPTIPDTTAADIAPEPAAEPAAEEPAAAATTGAETAASGAAPAGWYADPSSRFELRYWDGSQWTEHVSRAGQQYTDPPVA